ncbi:hypothetical protein [Capnocytophaga canimorsus]|uniref:Uncharacterized protein n=1 Tax=Capnocytophaga canimorsus (strain 5) TaxID=860228 RepID=F9YSN1_CAPCC|nr:hypothetical protein [Capnocytophaga canimorsus]AEK22704.1 Hypothetical protein Ccan_05840 [Capnocytophaga canimorsus Cc5]
MKKNLTTLFLLFHFLCFSQVQWKSKKYNYSLEIPQGFSIATAIGPNIDFKATKGGASAIVIVKEMPQEYTSHSIWDMLGDLETFDEEQESILSEYMDNPKFLKYGRTIISGFDAFWYDYTVDNPSTYHKTYLIKKGNKSYTITLSCLKDDFNYYSAIWYRFKNKFKID